MWMPIPVSGGLPYFKTSRNKASRPGKRADQCKHRLYSVPEEHLDFNEVYSSSDAALLQGKKMGRGKTVISSVSLSNSIRETLFSECIYKVKVAGKAKGT